MRNEEDRGGVLTAQREDRQKVKRQNVPPDRICSLPIFSLPFPLCLCLSSPPSSPPPPLLTTARCCLDQCLLSW